MVGRVYKTGLETACDGACYRDGCGWDEQCGTGVIHELDDRSLSLGGGGPR